MRGLLLCLSFTPLIAHALELDLSGQLGYRNDHFQWTIRGDEGVPNILSELEWKDLHSVQLRAKAQLTLPFCFMLMGTADWARIVSGKMCDSDWRSDNRTDLFSYATADASGGDLWDLTLGVGHAFSLVSCFRLQPAFGFSYRVQDLSMQHGEWVYSAEFPEYEGKIQGLDSSYCTNWTTVWIGLGARLIISDWLIRARYQTHWTHYNGTGNWNLRTDFSRDFEHSATGGRGYVFQGEVNYFFTKLLFFGLSFDYEKWESGEGNDITYFFFNQEEVVSNVPFNGADWRVYSVRAVFGLYF